ncbi:hypothetical protein Q5P01_013596 [Channa striata]|uniref:FAM194 C-terminal domain-containing protein n=1 Tax=Channa striata TaxID=64152 RepID=A0AA88MKR9_CHASR|nr:hypothetical protein Q5P01_013596 [Channa striata]
MELRVLDGRFITSASSPAQTDWEWVEQSLSFSCQVQKEIEELLLQAEVVSADTVPESSEVERSWQKLIAVYRGCNIEGGQVMVNRFFAALQIAEMICCEQAKQTRELIMKEREKLEQIDSDKNTDVLPHSRIGSEEEREPAKARADPCLCFSETGDLRRRWNWLYFDPRAHKLPFKPLTFALCPHISVRIRSQEHMYVTFTRQKNTVQFSVGSKLKGVPKNMKSELEISPDNEVLNSLSKETPQTPTSCQGETEQSLTNLDKTVLNICCERCQQLKKPPATSDQKANMADPEERYPQQKSAEINVLLQNIQSLITYQKTVSPQKVKP